MAEESPPLPDLEAVGLTTRELSYLYGISLMALDTVRHDVKGPFHGITIRCELLRRRIDKTDADWASRKTELLEYVEKIASSASKAANRVDFAFRSLSTRSGDRAFIASPSEIVRAVREANPDAPVHVREGVDTSLLIVYPVHTLFAMVWELVSNARHAETSAAPWLGWEVAGDRFSVSIEDSGQLAGAFPADYVPFQASPLFQNSSGLGTLWQLAEASGGALRVRRSPGLGGLQVKIDLPVIGFWSGGTLHRPRNVPG